MDGVNDDFPQTLSHLSKFLRQGKGHLKIVVRVKSHFGSSHQIVVDQKEHSLQVFFVHGSKSVYNRKSVRLDLIDHIDQFQQFMVRITENIYRLDIEFVALFLIFLQKGMTHIVHV